LNTSFKAADELLRRIATTYVPRTRPAGGEKKAIANGIFHGLGGWQDLFGNRRKHYADEDVKRKTTDIVRTVRRGIGRGVRV